MQKNSIQKNQFQSLLQSNEIYKHENSNLTNVNAINPKFPRIDIPLDIEARYFKENKDDDDLSQIPMSAQNLRSAKENKQLYMDTYAIKFRIPVLYVIESLIYSQDPQYVVQLVKYVLPEEENDFDEHNNSKRHDKDGINLATTFTHGLTQDGWT